MQTEMEFLHERLNRLYESLQSQLRSQYQYAMAMDKTVKEMVMYWKHSIKRINENV